MTNAKKKTDSTDDQAHMNFSADVSRLLNIVANALYTNHDVFLRELISNAADACDRLRYEAIQNPELASDNPNYRIHVYKDTDTRTLTVVDNGIGMARKELIDNLGTIAKSGTAALMDKMAKKKEGEDALKLIGQFGVGFYASYMVADYVRVVSRKAGAKAVNTWESDGASGFEVRPATAEEKAVLDGERGTAVILHIKDAGAEFLIDEKIEGTIRTYSDHVNVKIFLNTPEETGKGEGHPVSTGSAIWTRSKSDITDEQYTEFYRHLTHGFDEPLLTAHWHAEGRISYRALLFIPTLRPWDLYDPGRKQSVQLYVRRVFIAQDIEGLVYPWLRFLRGVVDSEDLPLNISRESLQYNPLIEKIKNGIAKRVLKELVDLAKDDLAGFLTFWGQFGPVLKEGLYDAPEHREALFKVSRFFSTHDNGESYVSLDEYVERMKDGQEHIYYISGENKDHLMNSPQIEGFKARGYEVIFFTDTIDDFWLQQVSDYQGKTFKSVTKGDIDLDSADEGADEKKNKDDAQKDSGEYNTMLAKMLEILSGEVDNVRLSKRLTESPVCLVASDSGVDMHMEQVLKIHQQYQGGSKPVLEINGNNPLITKLKTLDPESSEFSDVTWLLLDQARIIQGQSLKNPAEFARRMSDFIQKGLV